MEYSTTVTRNLVKKVLEDVSKVVVDHGMSRKCQRMSRNITKSQENVKKYEEISRIIKAISRNITIYQDIIKEYQGNMSLFFDVGCKITRITKINTAEVIN